MIVVYVAKTWLRNDPLVHVIHVRLQMCYSLLLEVYLEDYCLII